MNIFYLHSNPRTCAEMHVDKHCVKMILEYAQLLSTAHRVLDGIPATGHSRSGHQHTSWMLSDQRHDILYQSTHVNHPSAIWVRQSKQNYMWLAKLLAMLCREYTHRYGKIHKVERTGLMQLLKDQLPNNLPIAPFTEPPPAMPDHYKIAGDAIQSYKNYYLGDKRRLFTWKNRQAPSWVSVTA
jgi:hypothetical protein